MAMRQAARSPEESRRRTHRDPAAEDASPPPVLLLSHFCAAPFLCFGDVLVGASRTRSLVLHNPHEEPLQVELSLQRAAGQGFSVLPSRCELKPKEKITVSVTWTPLREGRVREIVTFLVNDFLKHQAILLGNAEEHRKKKRSLWNTSKKKIPASSKHNKRTSNSQNFNEAFSISQKVDRIRSPLQACENLAMSDCSFPTESSSLSLEKNKMPSSSISPVRECQSETCLPLFFHGSTAYSSLQASENVQHLKMQDASISKGVNFSEEVKEETFLHPGNETFLNPGSVSDSSEGNSKLILAPNYSSPLNITQSQKHFLSPDSFVNNRQALDNDVGLVRNVLSDNLKKENSEPMCLESQTVHEVCQTILSPDSFLNDNYGLKKGLKSEPVNPILSPTRFVKYNRIHTEVQQTCKLSVLSNKTSPDWRTSDRLVYNPEGHYSETPKVIFERQKYEEMKSHSRGFTRQNPNISEFQDASLCDQSKQPKRRPILSATVTKRKPTNIRRKLPEINKPGAKRCLKGIVGEHERESDNLKEKDLYLPLVEPVTSKPQAYKNEVTPSTILVARKRKSSGDMADADGKLAATEHTDACEIKRIHFSPIESTPSIIARAKMKETLTSKYISNRKKSSLKKKSDSFVIKTPLSKARKRTQPIVAVAQSHLTFIKPLKAAIPRHPMPFAAKNMFYDERWKEKQEQGFTWWLNYILTPDDFTVKTNVSEVNAATLVLGVENQHKISVPKAPTKEEVSLRAYTASRRLNRLRRTACSLFTSERMVKAIKRLEIEIEVGRLLVRKDRHLWKDIGQRQKVLNWLLSYNPLWLRIGLETVYGELIPLADNSDVTRLAVFILNRLLWNPDIAAEYRHPTVPLLFRDGHEAALSKFTLKKLLLLVCFLDHAKISRLIDHDPCLFCKDAEFKASKELLLAFSRDFLSGEGDLSRHLSLLGFPVSHVQTPLDEFDFGVTNLAVDLQCGVRLVRTMELLTQNWKLSEKLRIPAISRVQKMHNVDIVLQSLKSRGVQLTDEHGNTILSKDIVDRHREKTLGLLWRIAFAFQVDISLNLGQLKEEIDFLKHTYNIKRTISALSCHSPNVTNRQKDKRNSVSFENYGDSVRLLMDWVNAVCAFYNKKVENFTVCFSDGRVLCYLIHHYHPCYVPFDAICQRTTQSVACAQTGSVVLNSSSESEGGCLDLSLEALDHGNAPELYKELLENEKKNFHLVRSAIRDLGGVPAMIHHSDMSNTIPDEKVVITYLSFLCARLLDLRKEIRAARLIQTTWRKYKLKRDLKHHQERDKAARIIQSVVLNFLTRRRLKRKVSAALVIQRCWRRVSAQRKLLLLKHERLAKLQSQSASLIQAYWRSYSTRKEFLKLKHYSVILQSRIRMKIAFTSYKQYLWATVTIQRHWRACLRRKQDQQRFKMLKSASLVIQFMFRRWKRRQLLSQTQAATTLQRAFRKWHFRKQTRERSAIVIQSWYRMHRELQKYIYVRACVVVIQRRFRCFQAQKLYKRRKDSILTLQKHYRAYQKGKLARFDYLQKRGAAIRLQAAFRGMKARNLLRQIRAACVLQSYWRMRQQRFRFLYLKDIVIKLQAHIRKHQQLQKYKKIKKAAVVIQTHFRASISARKVLASYQKTRSSVIVLQSAYRGMQARNVFRHTLASVIKIQSYYRAYKSRKKFQSFRKAVIKLQSIVKMKQTRTQYLHLRAATLFIQRWYRSQKMAAQKRREYRQVRESCVRLQAYFRGCLVRKEMRLQIKAAISLQSYFRMRRARQRYLEMREAAVVIQNSYCAYKAQVSQRKSFLQLRGAAICVQAAYRGYKVRRLIEQQSAAAVTIQRVFRGHSQRMKYQTVLLSARKIQMWYRAHRTAHHTRTQFLKTRVAVVSLQSAYRGWRVRQQLRREHEAAVTIQSTFRMATAQKQFKLLRTAAVVIQQHVRAWAAGRRQRLEYMELRHAVLVCQATWKGRAVRRQIDWQHKCAVLIQAYYRMHVQQRRWKVMQMAALQIQAYYRAYQVGKEQRYLYLKAKAAIVILQSAYRGMKVRRRIKDCNKAAATIQAQFRAYKTQKEYTAYRTSAIIIQRWYRNIRITTWQRQEYLNLKKTAVKVQAVYRGVRVRRHIQHMHMAATLIKAMFKMHQSRVRYHRMRLAALVIQVRYRAYYLGKIQREKYLATLKAVKTLQAGVRGARVRQTVRKMQVSATVLQSHFRRHRQQTYFRSLREVTKAMQRRYRAVKERNIQFQRYHRLRHSAILIQAAFRGLKTRRHLKTMHLAATLIQRKYRTVLMRRKFLSLRKTVIWIQRRYRATLHARYLRQQLLLEKAATKIQSSYKGWAVRKRVQEMHRAAAVIQATFRMHRARVRYQALKQASVVIQNQYRAHRAAKLQRQLFTQQRHAAIILQAAFRGLKTRRHLKAMHLAAVLIQRKYRTVLMRRKFLSLRKTVIWIQRRYRATLHARYLRQQILLEKAATKIQSSYKGWVVRKWVQKMHRAATVIQATFRMHRARVRYQALRQASVVIQKQYRAHRAAKLQRQLFTRQRHAAVILQAAFRGLKTRRHLRAMHLAAVLIQRKYRTVLMRRKFLSLRKTVIWIQRRYLATLHARYLRQQLLLEKAATKIQSSYKGWAVRKRVQKIHRAATVIQATFRMHRARVRYQALKQASVVIQNQYRAHRAAKLQRQLFTQQRHAAIILQAAFRGLKTRRHLKAMHLAATLIQRKYRTVLMRRKFLSLRKTVIWQRWYCATLHARYLRQQLLLEKAATKIQSSYKGWVVRKWVQKIHRAATVIQATFRMHRARVRYQALRQASVVIQKQYRAHRAAKLQRQLFTRQRHAAVILQAAFRGLKTRRHLRAMHLAAVLIQRKYRTVLMRRKFLSLRKTVIWIQRRYLATLHARYLRQQLLLEKAATKIQSSYRGWAVRERVQEMHRAAAVIQATFRMHRARVRYQALKQASVVIQKQYRAHRAAKLQRQLFTRQRHAAVILQAAFRGLKTRRHLKTMHSSATLIQSKFRALVVRSRYISLRKAAIFVQRKYRATIYTKHKLHQFLQLRKAAITIQSSYRRLMVKKKLQEMHRAAALIQATFRMHRTYIRFHTWKHASIIIQQHYRTYFYAKLERMRFLKMRAAAIIIQRKWRATLSAKVVRENLILKVPEQKARVGLVRFTAAAYCHMCALRIQRAYRLHLAVQNAKKHISSVVSIQRWFRRRLQQKRFIEQYRQSIKTELEVQEYRHQQNSAASVIQKAARRFLLLRTQEKLSNSATRIQALWRGYSWRKKNDRKEIQAIRLSLTAVSRNVDEENKLYNRTARALHHLLTYKHLSAILDALKHLEVVTRLSPLCCENMAESGAISKIFFVIRSCNRSVPCMEVIGYAVQVLLNVAKYEKTTSAVSAAESCVDTLLELLQRYQEKPGDRVAEKSTSIFTRTCCLLALILRTERCAFDTQSRSKVTDRISRLYKSSVPKHKVDTEGLINKQKPSSRIGFHFIPERSVKTRLFPRLKPQWVLRRDNMEDITNSLQAIQLVMDTLGVPY